MTRKKNLIPKERNEAKREVYRQDVKKVDVKTIVFLDETGGFVGMPLEYGRALQGQRVKDVSPKGKKERVSCISAISLSKENTMATQSLVMEGSINQHAFLGYLEHVLLPTLDRGTVIILDNWTIHYGDDVRELVAAFGCELLYLPTYSPDLNPIEHLFAKVKTLVKKAKSQNVPDLIQAFCDAICQVNLTNILNSFRHCGYQIPKGL